MKTKLSFSLLVLGVVAVSADADFLRNHRDADHASGPAIVGASQLLAQGIPVASGSGHEPWASVAVDPWIADHERPFGCLEDEDHHRFRHEDAECIQDWNHHDCGDDHFIR